MFGLKTTIEGATAMLEITRLVDDRASRKHRRGQRQGAQDLGSNVCVPGHDDTVNPDVVLDRLMEISECSAELCVAPIDCIMLIRTTVLRNAIDCATEMFEVTLMFTSASWIATIEETAMFEVTCSTRSSFARTVWLTAMLLCTLSGTSWVRSTIVGVTVTVVVTFGAHDPGSPERSA
jgi:hypothetical protein